MLGTTLNKGTKVKIVIYSNFENEHLDYSESMSKRNTASCSISLSSNIISINYNYAKEFKIIKKLIEPWPGTVIKLINLEELLEKSQHLSSVSDSELAKIYDCIGKLSLDAIIELKLSGDPLEEDYSLALDSVINDLCSDRQTFIDLCIENDINKFYMIIRNFKQFNGLDKENSCLGYGLVNDNSSMNDNSEPDINKNYFGNSLLNSEDYDYYKQQIDMDRGIFNKLLKIQNKIGHFNNLTANYPRETKVLEDELLGKYIKTEVKYCSKIICTEVYKTGTIKQSEHLYGSLIKSDKLCVNGEIKIYHRLLENYEENLINEEETFTNCFDGDIIYKDRGIQFEKCPNRYEYCGIIYEDKWNGAREDTYFNGTKRIGYWYDDKPIGKHKYTELDGKVRIEDCGFNKLSLL